MAEGRDERGLFIKGNKGGPGPRGMISREIRDAINRKVPAEKVAELVKRAHDLFMGDVLNPGEDPHKHFGDPSLARVVTDYTVGKPRMADEDADHFADMLVVASQHREEIAAAARARIAKRAAEAAQSE